MSTSSSSYGSSSIRAAGSGFAASGRFTRPAQLDPALMEHLSGGVDPQQLSEISHTTAASLLDRVHHTQDPQTVARVLTLVEHEGVDLVAELWSGGDPDSLPGVLWRLYMLRTWMRRNRESISRLWRIGEPVAGASSAIAGVDQAPTAEDIARTADSILSGAFVGDFAVAMERASAFCAVISAGLVAEARRRQEREAELAGPNRISSSGAAHLLKTARSLHSTSKDFKAGARLWREGRLE
ncbi:thymidine phosphorylase [Bifidobacterium tissieri]|uniref:Thymidine phosphorylase n=2 Tax=Bifidobacterium tissieri TaxID=1630162 RepID=A0A261FDR2_9BIFI|nr:thymidine phosphorylase [Bifidobacterium tissieri]KAA8827604.1 thymidine phosphorylase [Bifidobacterium tissieri]KAA8830337.1 thymidine phosphorylase [Bifidobacterium tissieri]OZG57289.1 thymidine phosphorylase [Bifidobacterium tissieri]